MSDKDQLIKIKIHISLWFCSVLSEALDAPFPSQLSKFYFVRFDRETLSG